MTITTANTFNTANNADMIRNHLQDKVEKIQEKRASAKGCLRRAVDFLFSCESANSYHLPADMKARMYL